MFLKYMAMLAICLPCLVCAKPKLAVVIDDMGYRKMPREITNLPPEISVSIIPFTAHDRQVAEIAKSQSREVMLHLPMESPKGTPQERQTLKVSMSKHQVQSQVRRALNRVPDAVAANNHMGSVFTQHPEQMGWVMEILHQNGIGFLDSRTTARTVAHRVAKKYQLATNRRHIFLDHHPNPRFITRQIHQAIRYAKQNGMAIMIAHPLPITLRMLKQAMPQIQQEVDLVPISHALLMTEENEGQSHVALR